MRTFKLALALSAALALPSMAQADGVERLTNLLEPLESYSADFEQQILDGSGQRLQKVEGHMWLSRPGQFHWEVDAPYQQVVVSDGDKVYLYDPDLQQVSVRPLDTRVTHTPALLLSGSAEALTENYEVTSSQESGVDTFTLIPKSPDTLFESLELTFEDERLEGLQMEDSTGQRTAINFDDIEVNEDISASRFEFEIPEGADVIREGG
ncbi:outer membrane lipoprotein chaperone LolA [Chromohalobacter canadensis]|uniref:outer membrane lipoprotein chaperone LolA n=1 Tax=Chromohalobacter canadensis TaxID=141389 RepID=UPI0021C112F8|nr:outer membrane lipoprotein chaperone LolA [Chromohalobacter canadensis]MCT8469985.1 outer membrane lipoprotein chaperone LolA [Chromohalobacter canadensis]MCT8471907.1 outer membrane lipoprotein chaperone LolA [Chromohalobacter canadensis]MCT8499360.1 outer membrane lipoprotein chaperone LolA [Chromohalobacter canadensis]